MVSFGRIFIPPTKPVGMKDAFPRSPPFCPTVQNLTGTVRLL